MLASLNKDEEKVDDSAAVAAASKIAADEARRDRALIVQQQRDAARDERRRIADERQKAKDQQAREILLKREQDAELQRASDQKFESERRREEFEARQEAEIAAQQRREVNALKLSLACQHRALVLVIRDAWLPWLRFVRMQHEMNNQSINFIKVQRQRAAIKHMRTVFRSLLHQSEQQSINQSKQAERFALVSCMSRSFHRWHTLIESRHHEQREALHLYHRILVHNHLLVWIAQARVRIQIRDEQLAIIAARAAEMDRLTTLKRAWTEWQIRVVAQRDERAKEQIKAAMLSKVNGWLKEYKQGAVT